jgi:hypothetical protein
MGWVAFGLMPGRGSLTRLSLSFRLSRFRVFLTISQGRTLLRQRRAALVDDRLIGGSPFWCQQGFCIFFGFFSSRQKTRVALWISSITVVEAGRCHKPAPISGYLLVRGFVCIRCLVIARQALHNEGRFQTGNCIQA